MKRLAAWLVIAAGVACGQVQRGSVSGKVVEKGEGWVGDEVVARGVRNGAGELAAEEIWVNIVGLRLDDGTVEATRVLIGEKR